MIYAGVESGRVIIRVTNSGREGIQETVSLKKDKRKHSKPWNLEHDEHH